ncbi:MAG: DUF6441 family protein, partial [Burkholderiales bacterium]|nr:DUF6441 family protein [Burkholderiales bacterium]
MRLSLTGDGLLDRNLLAAWTREKKGAVLAGARNGMRKAQPSVKAAMQAEARRAFSIKRANFVSAFGAKVFDARRDIPPMMLAGALKAPWVEIFETGGTITPKTGRGLLIPLIRIGTKRFGTVIRELIRAGNATFVNVRGKVIVFAENIAETRSATRRFTTAARKRFGGAGRLKEVPIAVL